MKKNSGQVLVMGLVMVLILLFAIFFFFDIHNIIRGKMKLETAEQAAALAAARWQAESLNLVGEINLLIATESVLLDDEIAVPNTNDFTDSPEDTDSDLKRKILRRGYARVQSLNEMQSRITFIGPLIALAAAQQTAKQNGIAVVKHPDNHLIQDFEEYQRRLSPTNSIYIGQNTVNGYNWMTPYKALIQEIQTNGLAVRPSAMVVGIEGIQPSYLADTSLYAAIIACSKGYPAWCHWQLRRLIKMDDSYFEGTAWFSPDFDEIRFSQQSEIYPLEVVRSSIITEGDEDYESFRDHADTLGYKKEQNTENVSYGLTMDSEKASDYKCRFYNYSRRWFRHENVYSGPDISDYTPWRRGIYLRKDIAEFAKYGGPTAYAECLGRVPSIITFKSSYSAKQGKNISSGKYHLSSEKSLVQVMEDPNSSENYYTDQGTLVGGNYGRDFQNSGCVAKPIGGLGRNADINPTAIPIVLPVFHRANLIPSTMQLVRAFSFRWPTVEKFNVGLKKLRDDGKSIYDTELDDPDSRRKYFSDDTVYMLEALRLLGTKEFRRKGWNPEYQEGNYSESTLENLFDAKTKLYDPVKNPHGPGWLQQPAVHYGRNYKVPDDALKTKIYYYTPEIAQALNAEIDKKKKLDKNYDERYYTVPSNGETWIFYDGKFIRVKGNDMYETMEKDPYIGCGTRGGYGPGISPGTNTGPTRL